MLTITIPAGEMFNEKTNEFVYVKEQKLSLEHSLVSISKWEAKFKKSFFLEEEKTNEEAREYIKFMTLTQNVDKNCYYFLTNEHIKLIKDYISDPMTATVINEPKKGNKGQILTSELIYYYMISLNIPSRYEKWHINRLMTLIKVCAINNDPKASKKMSKNSILKQNAALNAARRAKLGTLG